MNSYEIIKLILENETEELRDKILFELYNEKDIEFYIQEKVNQMQEITINRMMVDIAEIKFNYFHNNKEISIITDDKDYEIFMKFKEL